MAITWLRKFVFSILFLGVCFVLLQYSIALEVGFVLFTMAVAASWIAVYETDGRFSKSMSVLSRLSLASAVAYILALFSIDSHLFRHDHMHNEVLIWSCLPLGFLALVMSFIFYQQSLESSAARRQKK